MQGAKAYTVTGMAWSPDSTMLAVAQSDNILFVYKVR
jgi:intraflagellar transport protein 172